MSVVRALRAWNQRRHEHPAISPRVDRRGARARGLWPVPGLARRGRARRGRLGCYGRCLDRHGAHLRPTSSLRRGMCRLALRRGVSRAGLGLQPHAPTRAGGLRLWRQGSRATRSWGVSCCWWCLRPAALELRVRPMCRVHPSCAGARRSVRRRGGRLPTRSLTRVRAHDAASNEAAGLLGVARHACNAPARNRM